MLFVKQFYRVKCLLPLLCVFCALRRDGICLFSDNLSIQVVRIGVIQIKNIRTISSSAKTKYNTDVKRACNAVNRKDFQSPISEVV